MHSDGTTSGVRLRLDLGYDGTNFFGWGIQPGLRTVQGELEAALSVLLRVPLVRLTVGGRTDTGVHARGQVAHITVTREQLAKWDGRDAAGRDPEQLARSRARRINGVLKRVLPPGEGFTVTGTQDSPVPDIAVHSVREVPSSFDARFSALRRRYEYRIRSGQSRRDPLTARHTTEVNYDLDFEAMQVASDEFLGLNDFTAFCKARVGSTAVRDLLRFDWRVADDGAYAAQIEADAFCHSMVRALVGSVVAVGSGRISLQELRDLRDARRRTSQFSVLPAHGLTLQEIAYPADDELQARAELTRARRLQTDD